MLISCSCSLSFLLCLIVMFISPSLLFLSFFTFILLAFPFSLPLSFPFFAQSFHFTLTFMSSVWKRSWGTPKKICKPQAYGLVKAHYKLLVLLSIGCLFKVAREMHPLKSNIIGAQGNTGPAAQWVWRSFMQSLDWPWQLSLVAWLHPGPFFISCFPFSVQYSFVVFPPCTQPRLELTTTAAARLLKPSFFF